MTDIDKWSDQQIRSKLTELGFPVMPITGTTRKLMVKKLKILLENSSRDGVTSRRSMGNFSSEEESDQESNVKAAKDNKNRRATMAVPLTPSRNTKVVSSMPTVMSRRSTRANSHKSEESDEGPVSSSKRFVTTTTTKVVKTVQDGFETGSDSEPEVIEVESSRSLNNSHLDSGNVNSKESTNFHSILPTSSSSRYTSPILSSTATSSYKSRYSSNVGGLSSNADTALKNLQQIRSRLSLGTGDRPLSTSSPHQPSTASSNAAEKLETPYLSDFTQRLSQLSSVSPKSRIDYKNNDIIKEHDSNGSYLRGGNLGRSPRYRAEINRNYYAQQHHKSNVLKDNWISFAVLGVAVLFFVAVGVMYYGLRNDGSALETFGNALPWCEKLPSLKPGIECIRQRDFESVVALLKTVKPKLAKAAVDFICGNDGVTLENGHPHLSENEILVLTKGVANFTTLNNLEFVILRTPEWGINVIDYQGVALKNMDDVMNRRTNNHQISLVIPNPSVPWSCVIANKVYAVFNTVLILSGVTLVLYALKYLYKQWRNYEEKKKEEVFNIVEQIINVLQSSDEDYLVINHVRDMILPLNDRKRMEDAWNKSVQFINDDSRVRTEVQVVQGEPFQVWRWLGSSSCSPRSKTWQGQAFETQSGSMNSLPYSPTPCLKIRGMIDDNTYSQSAVKEAVLSKCADQCRILHCGVDAATKCVYLKCADQNDAAIAYRNLHGWWYAGHLVTVKYLRLERYVQRFPESPISGPPFLKSPPALSTEALDDDD